MSSSPRRRRRCVICRHGFLPHPRVGDRQQACGRPECQQARRRRNQEAWRERHPGYFLAWRAKERAERQEADQVEPLRVAAPLSQLPWALAQDEFGIAGADFLGGMGRLCLALAKDQIRSHLSGFTGGFPQVGQAPAKDQIRSQVPGARGDSPQVGAPVVKDEIPPVPG